MTKPMKLWDCYKDEFNAEEKFKIVNGMSFSPEVTHIEAVKSMNTYDKMRDDDVIVSSYPRSGTHWSIALVDLVMHGGDIETVKDRHIHERSTWMDIPMAVLTGKAEMSIEGTKEQENPMVAAESVPSPRLLSTHLTYDFMPESVKQGKCKVVVILRNPKSVVTSLHVLNDVPEYYKVVPTIDQTIEATLLTDAQDQMIYGSWFNHVSKWWMNKDKLKRNIHFIFYEDMKNNMGEVIKGLAKFLNKGIPDEQIKKMAEHLQFEQMLKNPKTGKAFENLKLTDETIEFMESDSYKAAHMRKGVIDDWKTKLTASQSKRIDAFLGPRLEKIGLKFQYEQRTRVCNIL
ncbi:unnamed protein product [Owenia fusiformis]|uniref:Sulfotransferase domain-containing protein n=1 Tax=Owenia fusiformis TaxID=6347 RepID=A0A8S4NYN7_OWEFU|nr:unnamed protein product [Owenia fusiformis]